MSVIDTLLKTHTKTRTKARSFRVSGADGLIQWIVPLAIIVIWQTASVTGLVPTRVLPAPSDVALAGWKLLLSGELVRNIWVSFWRASIGFLIGGSIGFAFGLANGLSQLSARLTDTTLQMVRNVPHLALIPLVILWFGIDESAKLFLVALGVFFPIYLNTLHGIRTVDPQLIEMGRIYGMSDGELFRRVIFPGAALDLRGHPLRARHHVADIDRRRDHRGVLRPRLHGDAGARVHADRRRRALDPDLRAAR
jgi:sulfonate transport system permease protein